VRHLVPAVVSCTRSFAARRPLAVAALAILALAGGLWRGAVAPSAQTTSKGRRIEVLFLGHNSTHHDSARFAPMLKAALAPEGFNFSYTADPADLNPTNLAQYDALMIYANHTKISPEQEKALLGFVAGGKGFLPIHSASFCFQNSEAYISLVGGQFLKHGTGEFTAEITQGSHPTLAGVTPFQVWDETYVHTKHNTDRTVLMERVDAVGREPWTWVRTHGKGRVFYTAYGHDERVWGHPMFHRLIQNGLLWAIDSSAREQLTALRLRPFRYSKTEVPVPNYERRDPPPLYQQPLPLAESLKHVQLPPGFALTVFATEPMIVNPIAMAWDERGRLWVLETKDYPSSKQPAGQGNDSLKILEDTNRDGRADKVTVFADKLSIPTGFVFTEGGVMVAHAPEFLFLKDTNGDDKADVREVRITGWGTNDTHAGPSNLKYGLDNWLWGAVGYSGFRGNMGGAPVAFGAGLYRFTPDGAKLERMATFTNNTWGLAFTEAFEVFGSTANNEHSTYVAIPSRFYAGVAGLRGDGRQKIDGHYAMSTNTTKFRQVDVFGGFTAAAGHNFYTARAFPREYWNRVALVNEPTGRLLHRAIIEPSGSGFVERDGWNLLASSDEYFAPVHAEVGPDGAVWVLDWDNFIIQHNPTPSGVSAQGFQFRTGRGAAYETPLRASATGRIYRIAWTGAKPSTPLSLGADRPRELVQALSHDNMFWRTTAQRLLVERGQSDVLPDLYALANDQSVDAIGLNAPAIHALWTMHGLGALTGSNSAALDVARRAAGHPSAAVRKNALAVLPRTQATLDLILSSKLLADADPKVRLSALLAMAEVPESPAAGRAIYALSKERAVIDDEWLPEAVFIAAARHRPGFFAAHAEDVGVAEFARLSVRAARGELATFPDWSAPGFADQTWKPIRVPAEFQTTPLGAFTGTVWLRREIQVPDGAAGKPATLRLGVIDDSDMTYVNGSRVGARANATNAQREYEIPAGVLVPGRNVIALRISNTAGRGGVLPNPSGMSLSSAGGVNIDLAGQWRHRIEERWGGRRRDLSASVPLADQFLIHHGPVADLVHPHALPSVAAVPPAAPPPAATAPAAPAAGAPAGARGAGARGGGAGRGGRGGRGGPLPVLALTLSVVTGENRFDQTSFTARPGQQVRLIFNNTDDMQHNVVVVERGSLPTMEKTLIAMMADPTAQDRGFVPESPLVLFSTPLVNARQSTTLEFTAPKEPGEYPFICTFPGHWITMRGVLRVE
jgi:putative membrane-bound dehydrogenase-like protein